MSLTVKIVTGSVARLMWVAEAGVGPQITITRLSDGVPPAVVMGAADVRNVDGQWDDPEIPLGVRTRYQVTGVGSQVVLAGPVTAEGPRVEGMGGLRGPIVSDPVRGLSVPVVLLDDTVKTSRASRATAIDIEGRAERVIMQHVQGAPTRNPKLLTETVEAAAELNDLLGSDGPFLVRTTCLVIPDGWWQSTGGGHAVDLFGGPRSPVRVHTLGECEILAANSCPDVKAVGDTLGDLAQVVGEQAGTLEDIAAWSSLGDIAATDLKGILREREGRR